jgi:hypothetical protein
LTDFSDFLQVLEEDDFEEVPATVEQFVTERRYLNLPPLSEYQNQAIKAMSQIYTRDTLDRWLGDAEGKKRWEQTCNEVILQIGKGGGKDFISTVGCAYIVHLLLCLKDPAKYYGKPPGDAIDIINIAINAVQANRVFFKGFRRVIDHSEWFQGRYNAKANSVEFDKAITVHSGHSQAESWEGYNVLVAVLDEIAGFELENTTGRQSPKTSSAIYKMYKGSVDSRFPDYGKVVMLSFPRFKHDYIQQSYEGAIAEKDVVIRTHTFKINPDLPDGSAENEFTVEWEEDHIHSYLLPRVFALKRPTWDFNPTRSINDFATAFYKDPLDAYGRFACMPPEATDAFFKSREKIEVAFSNPRIAVDDHGRFAEWFVPNDTKEYYIHVDLAQKHDNCAVAMAHVESWAQMKISGELTEAAPRVVVDAVMFWQPTTTKSVDFSEVKDYIISLKQRGFNVRLVTFDRWNSHDMMQQLKQYGLESEILSVAKKHYDDMALIITEERLRGPNIKLLIDELLQLRINRDKVDHPRKGSKDLSDAVCGAIFNAVSHATLRRDQEIEVYSYDMFKEDDEEEMKSRMGRKPNQNSKVIIPPSLKDALESMTII